MIPRRRARALLLENVRGPVPDTALLQLDQHLIGCTACQKERARVSTLASLRDWAPSGLGAAARARIVDALASHRADRAAPAAARRSGRVAWMLAAGAAAAALVVFVARHGERSAGGPAPRAMARAGTLHLPDAELRYAVGARIALESAARTVTLDAGELDVSDGGAPVRVVTPHHVVVVSGRAMFAGERIRVYSGAIIVFDHQMRQLAALGPGDRWPAPAPTTSPALTTAPAPTTSPAPSPRAAATPPAPVSTVAAPSRAPAVDLEAALDCARAALAAGDAGLARRWAHRAFDAATTPRRRAEAELFLAECYLVEHEVDRAITVYRQVALSFPRSAEGEAAAFAAAQMLYERGRLSEARAALRGYLATYPDGRFAREATDRLSALGQ